MAIHCKSTAPSCSAVAVVFMAVAAALLYPAAVQATELEAPTGTRKSLTSALILGEESLLWLLLDRTSGSSNSPTDDKLEAISTLLTLFDLQEELNNSIAEAGQDDRSALTDMQTILTKVIQDSCNYINVTLHDSFTTNDIVKCSDDYDIHFTRQTFDDCTREAAKELQTRLELLISIRASENQVLSLPEFRGIIPDYKAWIKRGNFNNRRYLDCVVNSGYI